MDRAAARGDGRAISCWRTPLSTARRKSSRPSSRSGSARGGRRASSSSRRSTVKPGDIEGEPGGVGARHAGRRHGAGALKAQWKEVVVPENLAGRVLASRGEIDIDGTPKAYAVKGALDVGPPNELVHVLIDASGTDARADLRQLELRQSAGHLALSGTVEFKPVAWSLYAKAQRFQSGRTAGRVAGDVEHRCAYARRARGGGAARLAADRDALGRRCAAGRSRARAISNSPRRRSSRATCACRRARAASP